MKEEKLNLGDLYKWTISLVVLTSSSQKKNGKANIFSRDHRIGTDGQTNKRFFLMSDAMFTQRCLNDHGKEKYTTEEGDESMFILGRAQV